jgi:branched-chain amino acid transport system substrate-binding protein
VVAMDDQLGLKNCYENLSVPFGGVDFTADVLQLKEAGCDAVVGSFVASSNVAMASAIKDAGLNLKQFYYTSYTQATLDDPAAESALNGTYSEGLVAGNTSTSAKATTQFYNLLKQYDPGYHGGLPDLGVTNSWDATDVMIEGLTLAGKNPTRASFMKNLRAVTNFTADGLLVAPENMKTSFGNAAEGPGPSPGNCYWYSQYKGTGWVPDPKPVCGGLVPNSNAG